MDVSENRGTPKSSILIGFSIINDPFWGLLPTNWDTRGLALPGGWAPFGRGVWGPTTPNPLGDETKRNQTDHHGDMETTYLTSPGMILQVAVYKWMKQPEIRHPPAPNRSLPSKHETLESPKKVGKWLGSMGCFTYL